MADQSNKPSGPEKEEATPRLVPQLTMMWRALLGSPQRTKILLLAVAIVVVIAATAFGQVQLNAWNQPFYNAITRRDLGDFFFQVMIFAFIAGGLLVLNVTQTWLNQMTKVKLREGLVRDLFNEWLKPRRAFRLVNAGELGANPDQRIHEDARHLTELSTDLGIGLLQSSLLLGSFIGVLWALSGNVIFHLNGHNFGIPGYMVWCGLIYAGAGSWLSWMVGRPLFRLNSDHYSQEAELRFGLVRLNEHIDSVALYGGEEDEKKRLNVELDSVLRIMRRIVGANTRLTWVTAGYGWTTLVVPILVAAPAYFGGDLSFGALMVAVGGFNQVQQALRWFIDNFSTIADWRATLLRIASFREKIIAMDELGASEHRIKFAETSDGEFRLENLEIATPAGCTRLSETHVEIEPGEHTLIVGESGTGKTMLFRAMAGMWPWGSGNVTLPASHRVMFIPREPYLPLGTLRGALAYPSPETAYQDDELVAVLQGAGLDRLTSSLEKVARWDRELGDDEQQRLVFARLLLHKPSWVVIDEALDALDDDARQNIMTLLKDRLSHAAIVNIGRPETKHHFFNRTLHLIKDPEGRCFLPGSVAAEPLAAGVKQ